MKPVMSFFVTRPEMPVPFSPVISMPCSFAILRTSGEDRVRRRSARVASAPAGLAGAGAAFTATGAAVTPAPSGPVSPGAAAGAAAGIDAAAVLAPAAGCSPFAPMRATTLFTGTVSPSLTVISSTTPAPGDGISASTLSVEISKRGSSLSIGSPTFLIQRTIVPYAIDSPIWGITTSVAKGDSF